MTKRKPQPSAATRRSRRKPDAWSAEAFNILPKYDAIATRGDSVWEPKAARHALSFIESVCRHTEGVWAGKPFALLPWQRALVGNLYGWLRPDGTRRYRQAHVLIPRKAGKTELAAALALYHLLADDEPTPEVVGIARDRSQAKLCLKRAMAMSEQHPAMRTMVEQYTGRLVAPQIHGVYKVLSADAPSAHGLNVSACIADEIHAMENRRELWEAVMTSMGARSQPLMLSITTAGVLRESLEHDLFQYAIKVCERTVDNPAFLPCLYYADADDAWNEEATWRKANPSLGHTTTVDWYKSEAQRAHDQPSYESPFRTYYLCQHITAAERWLRMADWDKCKADTFSEEDLKKLPCFIGLDLAQTTDLSSICALWLDGQRMLVRSWNFAPEEGAIQRSRRDGVPYLEWSRNGWLTLTDGDVTDYAFLRQRVLDLCKTYRVQTVAYDPYNAQNLANELEQKGINVVRCPQSFLQMSTPTRMLERAVVGATLAHEGNPVLTWAVSNTVLDRDASGNPRPSKRRSVERIDPVIACTVAIAASLHSEAVKDNIYEKRGLIWL
jgi:phage terminase large subunit-like protein